MLRFTNATYMPRHELNEFQNRYSEQITASARTALRILGKRTNSMFYFNAEVEYGNSLFIKILLTTPKLNWQRPLVTLSLTFRTMTPFGRLCCMMSGLSA